MKLTALALGISLAAVPCVSAQGLLTPLALRTATTAAENETTVLVKETFDKMSAGTESAPDENNIADKRTGAIDATYTSMPGWSGAAIYQAGGSCAILKGKFSDGAGGYTEETGFLRTPQGAYAGNMTLTFRARLLNANKASDKMDIALLDTKSRLESKIVEVTPQWKTFELNFTKGGFTGCLIQMSMLSEEVLVDDIEVKTIQTSIPAPVATDATNYTPGGFTANWTASPAAEKYLLTVYEKKVDDAVEITDFDNLNVIAGSHKLDKTNPGFPEGWTVAYGTTRNADHISDNGYNGTTGMIFRATGEGLITKTFDSDILDFSFWASHPSGQECISNLTVSAFVDGQWGVLGNYAIERISQQGEVIYLSSRLPEGTRAVQLYFKKNDQQDVGKDVSIVVDHIRIMTEPAGVAVEKDIETTECSYTVTGLDIEKDYSYTVKAVNTEFCSAESNEISAYGLAAPVTTGASDVDSDHYTANWEVSPKAEGYMVDNYRVYTTAKDGEQVNILYENFNKVTEGSVDNPVGLYNVVNPSSLDVYTTTIGWLGTATYLANGMLGTRSYMGIIGMIQTPALDLSGNGGKFTVRLKITGDTDATNESVVVQAGMAHYIAMPIEAGKSVEREYVFDCGQSQMPLAIYSQNGFPFYVDEMTVTQTLPEGSKVFYPIEERNITDANTLSTKFENLKAGTNESFAYRVFAYRNFMGGRRYSLSGKAELVDLDPAGIDDIEAGNTDTNATYYSIDGIKLPGYPSTPGVYIKVDSTGSKKVLVK